ncbi:diguanylate cyclase domain-containing protein [Butyrivibrio proteoclasticus]|uniref:diguanylate cyclase domain-containing protein n=1 Tax=Butyrivibrio proteoclasticus TaxID=43305 RepID=UPI00047E6D04|nr:diguanylate cyclase [Butyrivibrio proteoclasticus]
MKILKKWQTWISIFICVGINWIGKTAVIHFRPPLWLDSIGTCVIACALGPVPGVVCGIISNIVNTWADPNAIYYMPVSVAIGIAVGLLYPSKKRNLAFHIISVGVFTGFMAAVLSTPINLVMYEGNTGNDWGDALMHMLSADIRVPFINTFCGQSFIDVPDKTFSVVLAVGIMWFFKKIFGINKKKLGLAVAIPLMVALLPASDVEAVDLAAEYAGKIYDTEDGLASIEVNALAQTNDGYIWAGSYSGLYRYDGYKFREMDLDDRIQSVMSLFVDSKGNLWICTNDSGVACYNPETEAFEMYSTEDGLSSNVIRDITEDNKGNIYVASIGELCIIDTDRNIRTFKEKSFLNIDKVCTSGENVAALRHDGNILIIKDDSVQYYIGGNYTAIAPQMNGDFVLGNAENQTGTLRLSNGGTNIINKYYTDNTMFCNQLIYSKDYDGYFIADENGLGFISNQGVFTNLTEDGFDSSINDVIIDYQGNIWFASSKQGIKRYTWNPFEDIFLRADLKGEVVNSVVVRDGLLYVATDSGLKTIDLKTYYSVPIPYPEILKGARIRDVICDSKDNLWFCTYGEYGLVELTHDGQIVYFNTESKGALGKKFRTCTELSDGTIVASTEAGLNFVKYGRIVKTLGEKNGINATVINLVEDDNGRLMAGTDGDGIYIIENREITGRIGEEDGLNTLVVMKIVPCKGGYIFVTSNALYYYSHGAIRKLENFPYSNNYDVYVAEDDNAWILSSAGIYIVNVKELIGDWDYNYILLNRSRGLSSSLTSNARYTVKSNMLYLCCTDGVKRININNYNSFNQDFLLKVSNLTAGDTRIGLTDGVYVIPPTSSRIQFDVGVLNYTLSNPLLHIYLEGAEDEGVTCYQNELQSLSFTNLPFGEYTLHVQVLDATGTVVQRDEKFPVIKESQLFERGYFKAYLYFVCFLFILYVGWAIGYIIQNAHSLEKWQNEASRDPLTGLYNKRGANKEMIKACQTESGILMILDLDSFKPVNDIFGHDLGDRMLISMAQMMKICTREEDILARIGGDEFVVFLKNADREEVIQDKTLFLNTEMVRAAKTYMGDDINIPIGVSVGAVRVPAEGRDYEDLLKKADKALYTVKNNGKHGYSIYDSVGGASELVDAYGKGGITGLVKILDERTTPEHPYRLDYNSIQDVYRILKRLQKGRERKADFILLEVKNENSDQYPIEILEKFYDLVDNSLTPRDIYCIDGKTKIIIMSDIEGMGADISFIDEIEKKWAQDEEVKGFVMTCEKVKL